MAREALLRRESAQLVGQNVQAPRIDAEEVKLDCAPERVREAGRLPQLAREFEAYIDGRDCLLRMAE